MNELYAIYLGLLLILEVEKLNSNQSNLVFHDTLFWQIWQIWQIF